MAQPDNAVFRKLAEQLAEMYDDVKLDPMREEMRRTAALVHKLDEELHERVNQLDARADAQGARIAGLEGFAQTHDMPNGFQRNIQTRSATAIATGGGGGVGGTVWSMPNTPPPGVPYAPQPAESIAQVSARLRSGMSMPVNINGGMRTVSEERPGVMAVQLEPEDVVQPGRVFVDPTAASLERISDERDMLRTQLATLQATAEQFEIRHRQGERKYTELIEARDSLQHAHNKLQKAFDKANNELGEVWLLVSKPDGHGSPFWTEPQIADTTPSEAIAAKLSHLFGVTRRLDDQITSLCHEKAELQDRVANVQRQAGTQELQLENENHLRIERDEALGAAEMMQLKLTGVEHTCIDQARQITELRTQVHDMLQAHAGELGRIKANRDSDFAEGSEQNKRLIADNQVLRVENSKLREELPAEREKRRKAEGACTEHRQRVIEIEAQLKAKDALLEAVSMHASEVPTLRATIATLTATVERMQPLVLCVQSWRALWDANKHRHAFRTRDSEEIAMDGNLATACEEYEAACARAADPDPDKDDCQAGTCDCGVKEGERHEIGCPEMPF